MAWTQNDLDALKTAIGQGAREVWYGDKRVAYRSLDEMLRIKEMIEGELNISKKPLPYHPTFQNGLS